MPWMGAISGAIRNTQLALADSDTFRTWVGAADQPEALVHIYQDGATFTESPDEFTLAQLQALRPHVLMYTDGFVRQPDAEGAGHEYGDDSGTVIVQFTQDINPADRLDPGAYGLAFMNTIGQIIDDITDLAGTSGYLSITKIELVAPWWRSTDEEAPNMGETIQCVLEIEWGTA